MEAKQPIKITEDQAVNSKSKKANRREEKIKYEAC